MTVRPASVNADAMRALRRPRGTFGPAEATVQNLGLLEHITIPDLIWAKCLIDLRTVNFIEGSVLLDIGGSQSNGT
jgi:hypothetical protein